MKILVVDDEKDVEILFRHRFRSELRSGKLEMIFCFSGEEALDYLRNKNGMELVLVLSDINMPGMTGIELLKHIKKDFPQLTVYMVTAYGDAKTKETAQELGADDFISKPVDFDRLREKIFEMTQD